MKERVVPTLFIGLFVLSGVCLALLSSLIMDEMQSWKFNKSVDILSKAENFQMASNHIIKIARQDGGEYALQVIIEADFEKNLDTHLLGHVAGNELYKQKGLDGMSFCTIDLWYACAHSLVIGALLEQGLSVFDQIHDVCNQVSGSVGYNLCFHGFGHGVIAFVNYELPDALELCKSLNKNDVGLEESRECVGGVIMDLRDGLHDKKLWRQYGQKYIPENPIQICEADYMPDEFRHICMVYITPFIFDKVGVSSGILNNELILKSFSFCESATAESFKSYCYEGFPKEFILNIHRFDVRDYEDSSDEELERLYGMCKLALSEVGVESCIRASVGALDRRGTYSYQLGLRYCSLFPDKDLELKNICLEQLITERAWVGIPLSENIGLCQSLPEEHLDKCYETIYKNDMITPDIGISSNSSPH